MKIGISIAEQTIGFDPAVIRDYVVFAKKRASTT
jgi:hypothetical protein